MAPATRALLLCVALVPAALGTHLTPAYVDKYLVKMWEDYRMGFKKEYAGAGTEGSEDHKKLLVFKDTLHRAIELNAANSLGDFGMTAHSDMTDKEFSLMACGDCKAFDPLDDSVKPMSEELRKALMSKKVPKFLDLRKPLWTAHTKHQGPRCAASAFFAASAAIEGAYAASGPMLWPLSEQWLMSCAVRPECRTCTPGSQCSPGNILTDVVANRDPVATEGSYEYTSSDGTVPACKDKSTYKTKAQVNEVLLLPQEPKILKRWLHQKGPFAVEIQHPVDLKAYQSGIVESTCSESGPRTAAVVIIGYGTERGTPYWLAKAAFGTTWGENGTIKLAMKKHCIHNPVGVIASEPEQAKDQEL